MCSVNVVRNRLSLERIDFIDAVAAAGFNIGSYQGMIISRRFRFKLARYLHTGFYTAKPAFAKVVCSGKIEIFNLKKVIAVVFFYTIKQGTLPCGSIVIRVGFVFLPSIRQAFINFLMEPINIRLFKKILTPCNVIVVVFYSITDMFFQFAGPFVAGVIRVLLAVPLEMLVALDILEAVFLVVIDGVMVMHGFCICREEVQHIDIMRRIDYRQKS